MATELDLTSLDASGYVVETHYKALQQMGVTYVKDLLGLMQAMDTVLMIRRVLGDRAFAHPKLGYQLCVGGSLNPALLQGRYLVIA